MQPNTITMSQRLYVYVKPKEADLSDEDVIRLINAAMPNIAKTDDEGDVIDLECKWVSYMHRLYNIADTPDFPYWNIFLWCYWDEVLNGMELRCFVKGICEALGADKWWYIEETSMDAFDDMTTEDFEVELEKAVGIEDFSQPRYFPNSAHHLFMDSSIKVNNAMD